ncbi:MAG: FkbM family methyltransferase [Parvularculaceae bacterium]|nr:FkbM family methyltransferase [Parvularculaceae bacterium]
MLPLLFAPARLAQAALHNASLLWRPDERRLFAHLRRMFRDLKIDLVLDVGANRGRYVEMLRACAAYRGEILAFEPIPDNAARIERQRAYDRRLAVRRVGLGRAAGKAALNVTRHDAMSSTLAPTTQGIGALGALNDVVSRIEIEIATLDAAAESAAAAARSVFVKIDTQGADLDVIAGGGAVLARAKGLQVEVPFTPIYEGMAAASAYFEAIERLGFALTGIFPVHALEDGRIVDADAVFRRV